MKRAVKSITMRAVLVKKFGGEDVLKIVDDVPIPEVGDHEVSIKVQSSGINPVDTYVRAGNYARLPELPYVPGKDGAGIIEHIGSLVTKFKVGQRVFCSDTRRMGTLAEYTTMKETNVYPLDDRLSFDEGAALGIPYFTAYHALFHKGLVKKGERVLVHGASGGVGLAAIQIAKANGMTVVGTAGTTDGLDLVRQMGADETYNHRDPKYVEEMKKSGNFDVILEMLANINLQNDLTMMNPRGRTVIIGCRGDIQISPRLLMGPESSVIGYALFNATPEEWEDHSKAIIEGIHKGWVKPVISKSYKLDQIKEAHHEIMNSSGAKGKLIVKIN